MKNILIISDTHGNQLFLRNIIEHESKLDYIIHLGDFYEDLDDNDDITDNKEIIRVPGIYHEGYKTGKLPKSIFFTIEDLNFYILHNLNDLKEVNNSIHFVLYGHTHIRDFYQSKGVYYLNPGHLKRNVDRDQNASYVLMRIEEKKAKICFKTHKFELIEHYVVKF